MDTTGTIDRDGDEILTDTVPDETLEAAAGTGEGKRIVTMNFTVYCC